MDETNHLPDVAVVGFEAAGCVPFHLKVLLSSRHPFAFFGSASLYELATAGLNKPSIVPVRLVPQAIEGSEQEFRWLDQSLSDHSSIRTVFLMEVGRFRQEILQAKLSNRFPQVKKRRLRGNFFPWNCFFHRPTLPDRLSFLKWQAWGALARWCFEPQGLLVLGPIWEKLFPLLRILPGGRNLVRECPEPYDRSVITDTVDVKRDQHPPSVLFFGHHSARKGTCWALQQLAKYPGPIRAIIAGKCDDEAYMRSLCESLPAHVTVEPLLHHVDDRTKETLFKRSSVIVMPYEIYLGSSGIIFESLIYRRKVLASSACTIDSALVECGAVRIYELKNPENFLLNLQRAMSEAPLWDRTEAFLRHHGAPQFVEAVLGS